MLNDTRVIKARLVGRKKTGGRVEVMVERVLGPDEVLAQMGVNHPPQRGQRRSSWPSAIEATRARARAASSTGCASRDATTCSRSSSATASVPLPLYITRAADERDAERYQTVYAREPARSRRRRRDCTSTRRCSRRCERRGVELAYLTLHVGAGTFQPVRVAGSRASTDAQRVVPTCRRPTVDAVARARARAAGACSRSARRRCARSSPRPRAARLPRGTARRSLFILPGYRFRVVDRLLTNFHLPRSTLLMLVSAFGGMDNIRRAYRHAIEQRYRFFSYGDAMLIERQ